MLHHECVYTGCPFHSDAVSTDVVLLCYKATMFRERIKATLNCVYQCKMMNNFMHVKNIYKWSSICQHQWRKKDL